MRSVVGWSDWKRQKLNNEDGLNLYPIGIDLHDKYRIGFGFATMYMTSTRETSEQSIYRIYSNGYNGELRCVASSISLSSIRLVKDKE